MEIKAGPEDEKADTRFLIVQERIIGQKVINIIWNKPEARERWAGNYIANIWALVLESGDLIYIDQQESLSDNDLRRYFTGV